MKPPRRRYFDDDFGLPEIPTLVGAWGTPLDGTDPADRVHTTELLGTPGALSIELHPAFSTARDAAAAVRAALIDGPTMYSGQPLVSRETPPDHLYLMLNGRAKVVSDRIDSHPRSVSRYRQGQWVGIPFLYRMWLRRTDEFPEETLRKTHDALAKRMQAQATERNSSGPSLQNRAATNASLSRLHDEMSTILRRMRVIHSTTAEYEVRVVTGHTVDTLAIPFSRMLELMDAHPTVLDWVEHQVAIRYDHRERIDRWVDANPLLRRMDMADRERLLQLGVLRRTAPSACGACQDLPYMRSGQPSGRVSLLLSGQGQAYLPNAGAENTPLYAGQFSPGQLIGHEAMVRPEDLAESASRAPSPEEQSSQLSELACGDDRPSFPAEEPRATDIYLSVGSEFIEFNWHGFRAAMEDRPWTWMPLLDFMRPGCVPAGDGFAHLVAIINEHDDLDPSALAYGMAYALAFGHHITPGGDPAREHPTPDAPPPERTIWLIDLNGERTFTENIQKLGFDAEDIPIWQHHSAYAVHDAAAPQCINVRRLLPGTAADPSILSRVNILWPKNPAEAHQLTVWARGRPEVEYVVLCAEANNERTRLIVADHLTQGGIQLIWVNDQVDPVFSLTAEVPQQLIRVDYISDRYRAQAQERADQIKVDWAGPAPQTPDPCTPVQHIVRLFDDPEGHDMLERGEFARLLDEAHRHPLARACLRLARMVSGRSVGLALGGGGIWGAGHIALLKELDLAGVPIDYISGTSFGAMVAGLYAACGMPALDRFIAENCPNESIQPGSRRAMLWGMARSEFFRVTTVQSLWSTEGAERMVNRIIEDVGGERLIACTEIPFFPATTNLDNHEVYVPDHGTVGFGVRAASGLPPALPGMRRHGAAILDGGLVANVPATLLKERGADYVIAANVVAPAKRHARLGRRAVVYDATIARLSNAVNGAWVAMWKAGEDQAALSAEYRLDMWTNDVSLVASWRGREISDGIERRLAAQGTAHRIRAHWQDQEDWVVHRRERVATDTEIARPVDKILRRIF